MYRIDPRTTSRHAAWSGSIGEAGQVVETIEIPRLEMSFRAQIQEGEANPGAIRDITDRKHAEKILREQEAQLRGLANGIPGVVYQFYPRPEEDYGYHFGSENAEALLGLSFALEDYFERFLGRIPPSEREALLASLDEAVEKEGTWRYEFPFDRPSGDRIWLRAMATPERREDELVFNGVLLDVTKRKGYERALQASAPPSLRSPRHSGQDLLVRDNGALALQHGLLHAIDSRLDTSVFPFYLSC